MMGKLTEEMKARMLAIQQVMYELAVATGSGKEPTYDQLSAGAGAFEEAGAVLRELAAEHPDAPETVEPERRTNAQVQEKCTCGHQWIDHIIDGGCIAGSCHCLRFEGTGHQ